MPKREYEYSLTDIIWLLLRFFYRWVLAWYFLSCFSGIFPGELGEVFRKKPDER